MKTKEEFIKEYKKKVQEEERAKLEKLQERREKERYLLERIGMRLKVDKP